MSNRLRIFAGSNGAGKSTLFKYIKNDFKINLGLFINADEIFSSILKNNSFNFSEYKIQTNLREFLNFYSNHGLRKYLQKSLKFQIINNIFQSNIADSYIAALLADFIRYKLINNNISTFSMETVFSHKSKIDFIKESVNKNYKVYLYFIATNDPEINQARIDQRVQLGGHSVLKQKIFSRHQRSIKNLLPALILIHRAYIFDNSNELNLIAEVTPKKNLLIIENKVPKWFFDNIIKKT